MGEKGANAGAKRSGMERSDDICHSGLYLLWVNDRLGGAPRGTVQGYFLAQLFLKGMVMYYWALAFFFLIYIYTAIQKTQGPLQLNHPQLQNGAEPILKRSRQHVGSDTTPSNNVAYGGRRQNGVFN